MKNSREKGKRGERELAKWLNALGYDTRRGQQYCGANGDADVVGIDGMHIECKRYAIITAADLKNAMEQSKRDALDGEVPVVFHREDRKKWRATVELRSIDKDSPAVMITMDAEDFMTWWKWRCENV